MDHTTGEETGTVVYAILTLNADKVRTFVVEADREDPPQGRSATEVANDIVANYILMGAAALTPAALRGIVRLLLRCEYQEAWNVFTSAKGVDWTYTLQEPNTTPRFATNAGEVAEVLTGWADTPEWRPMPGQHGTLEALQ